MHHERRDGSGYHRGASGMQLRAAARILAAADAFQAMTQDRPHRPGLAPEAASASLAKQARSGRLDPQYVRAVIEAAGQPPPRVRTAWPASLSDGRSRSCGWLSVGCRTVPFRAAAPDLVWDRPQRFTVHALGDTTAEVTEGGREFGGIWARERYDWSDPDLVVARVLDSNIFGPGSRWELRVRPVPAGGSRVEWASLRQPSSLKGRLVVLVLRVAGRPLLRGNLQKTLA